MSTATPTTLPEGPAAEKDDESAHRGPLHPLNVWKHFRRNRLAVFGLGIVIFFVLVGVFAPALAPYHPELSDTGRMNEAPSWLARDYGGYQPGTSRHAMGLDVSGRDILSRIIYGARTSILVGLAVVSLAGIIGVTLGALAGYFGGKVDTIVMRAVDILMAIPFLVLAIAVISIFPRTTLVHLAVVLGLASWPSICRLMRAQVLQTREMEFVMAARALGASHGAILRRHIIPNCIAPVIIWFFMGIAGAIMSEASLSFLGLGDPDSLSWGTLINTGLTKSNFTEEWWTTAFPGVALALLVFGFNLVGDGLQDAINPRARK